MAFSVDRDGEARSWLEHSLAIGGPWSLRVLERFNLSEGTIYAPTGYDDLDYKTGNGGSSERATETINRLGVISPGEWVVVEDELALRTDNLVDRPPTFVVYSGNNVLRALRSDEGFDFEKVTAASHGYPRNIYIVDAAMEFVPHSDIGPQLDSLVEGVRTIIVGAHDDESFVVWRSAV